MDDVNITFDEQGKIRVLEPEIYQKTQDMRDCAEIFTKNIGDFEKCVEEGLIIMDEYAKKIEKAKLRAISQRNMTQNETESCSRRQVELNALLKEKQEELERANAEYQSLAAIENEQRIVINKLTRADV